MVGSAIFSDDQHYRYVLTRRWNDDPLGTYCPCVFIGLNPSTATADKADPTVRRCIGYARDWGFDGLVMLNIFALRSARPSELYKASWSAIGPANSGHIIDRIREIKPTPLVVCAWGSHGTYLNRGAAIAAILRAAEVPLFALRFNKDGSPTHPLYLPSELRPIPWEAP